MISVIQQLNDDVISFLKAIFIEYFRPTCSSVKPSYLTDELQSVLREIFRGIILYICMCENNLFRMIPCERAIKMFDVIPECFLWVPFEIKLNHLGYRLKRSGITSHIF